MGIRENARKAAGAVHKLNDLQDAGRQRKVGADDHYVAEVNKGDLSVSTLTRRLNERYRDGWELSKVFEQAGNTVLIWERQG